MGLWVGREIDPELMCIEQTALGALFLFSLQIHSPPLPPFFFLLSHFGAHARTMIFNPKRLHTCPVDGAGGPYRIGGLRCAANHLPLVVQRALIDPTQEEMDACIEILESRLKESRDEIVVELGVGENVAAVPAGLEQADLDASVANFQLLAGKMKCTCTLLRQRKEVTDSCSDASRHRSPFQTPLLNPPPNHSIKGGEGGGANFCRGVLMASAHSLNHPSSLCLLLLLLLFFSFFFW